MNISITKQIKTNNSINQNRNVKNKKSGVVTISNNDGELE